MGGVPPPVSGCPAASGSVVRPPVLSHSCSGGREAGIG